MTDGLSETPTQLDTTPDQVVEQSDLLVMKAEVLGFKKADVTLIKAKYATDQDAQEILKSGIGEGSKDVYETFLQPFLVLKEVFGQEFFDKAIGIYTNYQIPYNQLQQAAKDLSEYRKQLEAGIFNVTMDDAHALLHTLQTSGTVKEFFDKQKKETIHFTDDRLQVGASPGEKKSYTDFFVGRQDAYVAEFAKLLPVEQFTQFSPDVRDNMSAGLLHRWIGKVDTYVATHADKKFDKIDLNELWRVSPFSPQGKEISGVDANAFVTALGTVTVPEGAKLDECTQLMDPLKFTTLVNNYTATQQVALTEFLPAGSRYEFGSSSAVLTRLQRVASIMKAAPDASAGKAMVASVKPLLKGAGEQMKGVAEMLKGFMDELKASGVLEQIKELFATWAELTASFDVTKMLETEKGDPQKLVAVQMVLDQVKPGLQNVAYTPENFSKTGGIKEQIQKIDPVTAEGSIRQSLGDEGYKKLFLDSTITDPSTLPKGNGVRILMMTKMMTALGYTPAQREEAMKDANQQTAYTKMLGEYAEKKKGERTEAAGRKFNDKSDGAVVEQGGERFARSLISSIFLDETKAKVDYSAQPKIETKEGADEINHLDGVAYHVDVDKKLHIDSMPTKIEKLAVKVNGVLTEITPAEVTTKTIDLSSIVSPVVVDLIQWSPAKKTWSETNKLDAVEIDMDMQLAKKDEKTLTLAGLDIAGAYETKLIYTKDGQTSEVLGSIDAGSTTKDIALDQFKGTATHVLVRKKEPISTKQLPWQKVSLPPVTEAKK